MDPNRVELLKKTFHERDCLGAIGMTEFVDYRVPIGTPLVMHVEPFTAAVPANIGETLGLKPNQKSSGYYSFGEKGKTTLRDLVEVCTPTHSIEILTHSVARIKVINLFPNREDGGDYTVFTCPPVALSLTNTPPLFWDTGLDFVDKNICETLVGPSPIETLSSLLSAHRCVTFCFTNLNKQVSGLIFKDIHQLFTKLHDKYSVSKCYSCTNLRETGLLADVGSVSFYNLSDIIAVYDSKKAVGVAVDISVSSSLVKAPGDLSNTSWLVRFIFNIHKENIYTIDGEPINRWPNMYSVNTGLSNLSEFLTKNTPSTNHMNKTKKVSGRSLECVE